VLGIDPIDIALVTPTALLIAPTLSFEVHNRLRCRHERNRAAEQHE